MSFSSRRRNYMLQPHRRDGLIEWMKHMVQHSFVLDALASTAPDTFLHFEQLVEEHRALTGGPSGPQSAAVSRSSSFSNVNDASSGPGERPFMRRESRLKQIVPTVGVFHTCRCAGVLVCLRAGVLACWRACVLGGLECVSVFPSPPCSIAPFFSPPPLPSSLY